MTAHDPNRCTCACHLTPYPKPGHACAPDERHLQAFRRVLLTVKIGRTVSVNTVRDLLAAADLAPSELGALFRHACLRGWLQPTGRVVPSTDPTARGRLVREYRRQPIGLQQPRKAA